MIFLKKHISNIILALIFLAIQVFIFSNINLFSWLNPLVYTAFVFLFPTQQRMNLIIYAFLLGISIDFILLSGGINAFSLTLIAYLREPLWRKMGVIKEEFIPSSLSKPSVILYLTALFILIFIHHLSIFLIENFSFHNLFNLFFKILLNSFITFVTIILIYKIFRIPFNATKE